MDHIVIEGVAPYDGRYEFDLELSTREWGWVKRLSGYLPLTIEEGFGDPELIVVFACIALRRAGKATPEDVPKVFADLSDAPFGPAIRMELDAAEEPEDDAGPPAPSSTANGASSGPGSRTSSEMSPLPLRVSGTPGSATTESAPTRSGN